MGATTKDLSSQSLALLRFPLAVVVLTQHIVMPVAVDAPGTSCVALFCNIITAFFRSQSVPIYYFISGYVFFKGVQFGYDVYKKKLRNRLFSLFIPYLVWNMVALLWYLFKSLPYFASLAPGISNIEKNYSFKALLMTFWDNSVGVLPIVNLASTQIYPVNSPLWYIRDLIIVVLATPVIYYVIKKTRFYAVALLLVLWYWSDMSDWGYARQLLSAFAFFSFGAYMSIFRKDMIAEFGRFSRVSYILYALLGIAYVLCIYYMPQYCDSIKRVNVLVGLLFAYNISSFLISRFNCRPNTFLSSASFFIYVSHFLVYNEVFKILKLIIPFTSDVTMIFLYIATIVVCVVLLLSVYYLMGRFTPGVLNFMTGRK